MNAGSKGVLGVMRTQMSDKDLISGGEQQTLHHICVVLNVNCHNIVCNECLTITLIHSGHTPGLCTGGHKGGLGGAMHTPLAPGAPRVKNKSIAKVPCRMAKT